MGKVKAALRRGMKAFTSGGWDGNNLSIWHPDHPLNRAAAAVVRRVLGIQRTPPGEQLRRVPDDLPRDTLFSQPFIDMLRTRG